VGKKVHIKSHFFPNMEIRQLQAGLSLLKILFFNDLSLVEKGLVGITFAD